MTLSCHGDSRLFDHLGGQDLATSDPHPSSLGGGGVCVLEDDQRADFYHETTRSCEVSVIIGRNISNCIAFWEVGVFQIWGGGGGEGV